MSAVAHIKDYKTGKFYRDEFRGDISWNGYEHNMLLRNEGRDCRWHAAIHDVAMATGADEIRDSRGMATADFDNDGDLDIVINNNPGDSGRAEQARATLLRNNVGERRNWLAVELTRRRRRAIATRWARGDGRGWAARRFAVWSARVRALPRSTARGSISGWALESGRDAVIVRWPNGRVWKSSRTCWWSAHRGASSAAHQRGRGVAELLTLPAMQSPAAGSQVVAAK